VLGRRRTAGADWLRIAGRCRGFIEALEEQDAYRASCHLAVSGAVAPSLRRGAGAMWHRDRTCTV